MSEAKPRMTAIRGVPISVLPTDTEMSATQEETHVTKKFKDTATVVPAVMAALEEAYEIDPEHWLHAAEVAALARRIKPDLTDEQVYAGLHNLGDLVLREYFNRPPERLKPKAARKEPRWRHRNGAAVPKPKPAAPKPVPEWAQRAVIREIVSRLDRLEQMIQQLAPAAPAPVDPDLLAVRETFAADFEARGMAHVAEQVRAGDWDSFGATQALVAQRKREQGAETVL